MSAPKVEKSQICVLVSICLPCFTSDLLQMYKYVKDLQLNVSKLCLALQNLMDSMIGLGGDCASPAGKTVQICDLAVGLWFPGSSVDHTGLVDVTEDKDCSYSRSFHGRRMNGLVPTHQSSNGPLHRNPLLSHNDGMWLYSV